MTKVVAEKVVSLKDLCELLSISVATGKNWVKLGKIIPISSEGTDFLFSYEDVEELKESIASGKNSSLKSRRNKKYVSGNNMYESYISDSSKNLSVARKIISEFEKIEVVTDEIISTVIVYFARQMIDKKFDFLLDDIISSFGYSEEFIANHPEVFQYKLVFEQGEDVLGLLYLSLKNIGDRKSKGAYYTPTFVVNKLIKSLFEDKKQADKTIIDPCCGTGNFILQLPNSFVAENVYASDIDLMSVLITRVNYANKFKVVDKDLIYRNIFVCDYLNCFDGRKYDFIIGNPPWGCEFTPVQKDFLRKKYSSANGTNIESFDVVVEQALLDLNKGGVLAFVLPEAFLNVKSHTPIRKYLMCENSISSIEYLGDVFDGVQCPSVILQISHNFKPFSTKGMHIASKDKNFIINTERDVCADCFSFLIDDEEYSVIKKLVENKNNITLKNNAQFALGIVTGDNLKYVSKTKSIDNEPVLKGSDISKFKYNMSENYINFKPDEFQQVAPTEFYRANEKLLYKFISNKLVFAYDNKQTLSLNSCNILIPQVDGLSIKYIMAVLNSSVAQFFFSKQFNSIKVLRSHIEQIPIPVVSKNVQDEVENLVDKILYSTEEKYQELYEELDYKISKIYSLTDAEISLISC